MKLKICGMKIEKNIVDIGNLQPDYMGFIFYVRSKRYVGNLLTKEILNNLPENVKKVAVFVNAERQFILDVVKEYKFDYVQLHGHESAVLCKFLHKKVNIIKAFRVDDLFDFSVLKPYQTYCTYFLFDTKAGKFGGTGKKFHWEVLNNYDQEIPFFLSGGIGLEDIEEIKTLTKLNIHAIDVNSRFEIEPGRKDVKMIKQLKDKMTAV